MISIDIAMEPSISTLAQLRADIALTKQFTYFQTGSEGPVPDSTQRLMAITIAEENTTGLRGRGAYAQLANRAEQARESLARLLHVTSDTLAWTQNTSLAIRLAVGSLPWRAGDRLALTSEEHISTRILKVAIEQITGRPATIIPVAQGEAYSPADFLEALDRLLTPDHRLFIISHVSCINGARLPVAEAVQLAHQRGVKVLVDGAQAVGQFPVDVSAIDPEFYAGSVHKWLLGPAGIGYLYVARRQLPEYHPNLMPSPFPSGWEYGGIRPATAAGQTQIGTETLSLRMGAGRMTEIFQRIGLETIEAHSRALTYRLRYGLKRIAGFEVLTPYPWEYSSGITSLYFPGWPAERVQALIDRIWDDYQIVVKRQMEFDGIRISIASFNTEAEVDRLLEALAHLVPVMKAGI